MKSGRNPLAIDQPWIHAGGTAIGSVSPNGRASICASHHSDAQMSPSMPRKKNSRCGITSSQRRETPLTGASAWPCTEIGMRRGGVVEVDLISDAMAKAAYAH